MCKCERACVSDISCQQECSGRGSCSEDDTCICDFSQGFKGAACELPGCPGWPLDCMGHGKCNKATRKCDCDPGWYGEGCHIPDCPGTPDCNGVDATCKELVDGEGPICNDCKHPYIGDGCEYRCVHGKGKRLENKQWVCECQPCYSGVDCSHFCSGFGTGCEKEKCTCKSSYWGDTCEISGCPGNGSECSGHGTCNRATKACLCNSGWGGEGCSVPICADNCNGRGACVPLDTPTCECNGGFFGRACEHKCKNGKVAPNNTCICSPCYHGYTCDTLCSGIGQCTADGRCDCGFSGGRGDLCEIPGCPGHDIDCSGHGTCIAQTKSCICRDGWEGDGCEKPKCPDDCNNRGKCSTAAWTPFCSQCEKGWVGTACEIPCNGTQIPMDSGKCVCDDSCTHGKHCEFLCNGRGQCSDAKVCICEDPSSGVNAGWWGSLCTENSCPGVATICSDHGSCNKKTLKCLCDEGWSGDGCNIPDCPATPDCSNNGQCKVTDGQPACACDKGWMGVACALKCMHGSPDFENGICVCHSCYSGVACEEVCNKHGSCDNGTCKCEAAWRG